MGKSELHGTFTSQECLIPSWQGGGSLGCYSVRINIQIAYKPRTVVFLAWCVEGVFWVTHIYSKRGEWGQHSSGLGSDHDSWRQEGFRVCSDDLKGSDSGWTEKWPSLSALKRSFDVMKNTILFDSFCKGVTANLVPLNFSQGQTLNED